MTSNPTSQRAGPYQSRDSSLSKSTMSYSYSNGELDGFTQAVLDDLGQHVPLVTFQDFLDHLAPHQPKFNLEATMERLKRDPEGIIPHTGRWSAFNQDPKDQPAHEGSVHTDGRCI
jgi:hypothetical protein